jgi:hypothetical protein
MSSKIVTALACSLLMLSCSGPAGETKTTPAVVKTPASGLHVTVTPQDAEVIVGKTSYGPANQLDSGLVELGPGIHRVTIRKDGYEPWRAEVAVRSGLEELDVVLTASESP